MDLTIVKGKTFSQIIRWGGLPYIYKAITAISQTAPVSITSTGHGVPDGWPVAIVSVLGMTQINALNNPPRSNEYKKSTLVSANQITVNEINAARFSAYTSGGYIQYYTPIDLAGYTARMSIKDKVGGTEFLRLDTTNARIILDNTTKTVTLLVDATTTAALTATKGVYDLEMVSGSGVVDLLTSGAIVISSEVTTT
jgi:hypothetical protein